MSQHEIKLVAVDVDGTIKGIISTKAILVYTDRLALS